MKIRVHSDLEKTTKMGTHLTCFFWFDPPNKSAFAASCGERERKLENRTSLSSTGQGQRTLGRVSNFLTWKAASSWWPKGPRRAKRPLPPKRPAFSKLVIPSDTRNPKKAGKKDGGNQRAVVYWGDNSSHKSTPRPRPHTDGASPVSHWRTHSHYWAPTAYRTLQDPP